MNAYEIADGLGKMYIETDSHGLFNKRIQNTLRQQADRIAELESELSRHELRDLEHTSRIAELEKEKIRAYDNGYEDGRKPNTQIQESDYVKNVKKAVMAKEEG